jgi:hypothetical protein
MSTQIDLGPVLPILKGDWDATTVYERLNIVRHNSASWICNTAVSQGVEPAENSTDWYLQAKDMSSVSSVNGMKGDVEITTVQTPSDDSDDISITNTEWVRDRIDEKIDNAYEYTDNAISAATTSILDIAAQDASNKATTAVNQALAASETIFAAKETVNNLTNSINALTEKNATQDTAIAAAQSTANSKQDKLGFTPIQQGGGVGQVGNKIYIGWSGSGLKCTVDSTDLGTLVRSVNGTAANAAGNVTLSKADIVESLGYTPLQTAPVTSVNGKTGAVTVSVPVTSVNGMTGAVKINVAGTKVNNAGWADGAWSATVTPSCGAQNNVGAGSGGKHLVLPSGGTWAWCGGSNGVTAGVAAGGTGILYGDRDGPVSAMYIRIS